MFVAGKSQANPFIGFVKHDTYLRVDRPFFCAIADSRTRALLFVGAIYNP